MKQENNIEKLFQEAFENFEVNPPVSVKIEIDKQLGTKRNKPGWILWWSTIVILLLTGVVFAVVKGGFYNSSSDPGLTGSEQHATASKGHSKTNETNSDDQLTSEGDSENNQSELTSGSEPGKTEKQKAAAASDDKKTASEQSSSSKTKLKNRRAFSAKKKAATADKIKNEKTNGLTSGKKEPSGSAQKTPVKTTVLSDKSKSASKSSLKTTSKRGKNFSVKKKGPDSGNEGQSAAKGSKNEIREELPLSDEKQPKVVPVLKSEKENPAEKRAEPADSIANVVASADSTDKSETETSAVKPPKDDSKARNWMVEIYGGPRFGAKTSKTDFALKSANSYQIGLGFSRKLNLGPLKYLTLDGEYGGGKESYRQSTTTSSVFLAGIDSIPVLDTSMTDTLGYTYVNNYDTLNQTTELTNNAQITRFAFGLRTQFNFDLGSGFGVAVSPGYYYSRSKYQFSDSSSTSSSSQILLNLSLYYDWNRFRFRVGLDSRYELMGKNQHAYFDRRKSVLFTPQFGIGFKF